MVQILGSRNVESAPYFLPYVTPVHPQLRRVALKQICLMILVTIYHFEKKSMMISLKYNGILDSK